MASLTGMGQGTDNRESDNRDDEVRQRSGWLLPLVVFVVTAALSGAFLVYYLVPPPSSLIRANPAPTSQTDPVATAVGDMRFVIPANYLIFAGSREGGRRKDLAIFAALPDFRGYGTTDAKLFSDHSAESPVINVLIREEKLNLPEGERLARIYLGYVANPRGQPGPFGLIEYAFREDNGYRGEDLFVGEIDGQAVVMQCWRFSSDAANPDCLRDQRLSRDVTLSYRFKRANLAQWREIATGVHGLIAGFSARAK